MTDHRLYIDCAARFCQTGITLLFLLASVPITAQEIRNSVILAVGGEAIYTTQDSIAVVSSPPGTNQPPNEIVRAVPEQYGNTIRIKGVRKGEAQLLVESTAGRVTEVVTVSVVDKAIADSYRRSVDALAGVDGISANTVFASGTGILITGTTYSAGDASRCASLETPLTKGKPAITCAARPDAAAAVVFPQGGYSAVPSATLTEAGGVWSAEVRLGDVPFAFLSASRSTLIDQCISVNAKLRRAIGEWRRATEAGRIYPIVVKARRTARGFELAMQSKLDQGTRGEVLTEIPFDQMQSAVAKSGTTPDRLAEWWAATLQEAFRLYFLGMIPQRTGGSGGKPTALAEMYRVAVGLESSAMSRTDAPFRLARGSTALRWSSGSDPFSNYATRVPSEFQP